jgi:hypothetical protein
MTSKSTATRQAGSSLPAFAILGVLFLVIVWRVALSWRFFDRFLGDDGWVLRVAQRVAEGELLYRDVGWDYGPLPIYALSLLFRISPSVIWSQLLDIVLSASAVCAVYLAGRSVVGRRASLAMTSWAALLGSSVGLISHQLDAYTSAVAWGSSTSLAAAAAACVWVQKRSLAALLATCLFTLLALLSKPEYGLAGLSVLAAAVWLGRPSKRFGLLALGLALGLPVFIVLRVDPETLAAWWRGYSGYDLIAAGSVGVLAFERLFSSLLVAAVVGAILWWTTRTRSIVAVAGLLAAFILVLRVTEGDGFLHAASRICQVSWLGVVPTLLWVGWAARNASMPAGFWILWVYSITVSLRWFLVGEIGTVAAGPVALLFCLLVSRRVLHRPTSAGWVALATFLLFSSVGPELRSLRKPTSLRPVTTTLGTVRLPVPLARNIEFMQAALDAAPAGGLFVSGPGPGWYLVSGRHNPTRFDLLFAGIGTTEPEVTQLLDDLRSNPSAVVLFHRDFPNPESLSQQKIWFAVGLPDSSRTTTPDGRWTLRVVTPQ